MDSRTQCMAASSRSRFSSNVTRIRRKGPETRVVHVTRLVESVSGMGHMINIINRHFVVIPCCHLFFVKIYTFSQRAIQHQRVVDLVAVCDRILLFFPSGGGVIFICIGHHNSAFSDILVRALACHTSRYRWS